MLIAILIAVSIREQYCKSSLFIKINIIVYVILKTIIVLQQLSVTIIKRVQFYYNCKTWISIKSLL